MSHHYSGPDFGFPHGDARLDLADLHAFPKIHSRPPGCRPPDVRRTDAGEQRNRSEVLHRLSPRSTEARKRYPARNCKRGGESFVIAEGPGRFMQNLHPEEELILRMPRRYIWKATATATLRLSYEARVNRSLLSGMFVNPFSRA